MNRAIKNSVGLSLLLISLQSFAQGGRGGGGSEMTGEEPKGGGSLGDGVTWEAVNDVTHFSMDHLRVKNGACEIKITGVWKQTASYAGSPCENLFGKILPTNANNNPEEKYDPTKNKATD